MSEHECYLDCSLPDTAKEGEKLTCDCGRSWRFDGQYYIVEGMEQDDGDEQ